VQIRFENIRYVHEFIDLNEARKWQRQHVSSVPKLNTYRHVLTMTMKIVKCKILESTVGSSAIHTVRRLKPIAGTVGFIYYSRSFSLRDEQSSRRPSRRQEIWVTAPNSLQRRASLPASINSPHSVTRILKTDYDTATMNEAHNTHCSFVSVNENSQSGVDRENAHRRRKWRLVPLRIKWWCSWRTISISSTQLSIGV
jgi:hypothetical protein